MKFDVLPDMVGRVVIHPDATEMLGVGLIAIGLAYIVYRMLTDGGGPPSGNPHDSGIGGSL